MIQVVDREQLIFLGGESFQQKSEFRFLGRIVQPRDIFFRFLRVGVQRVDEERRGRLKMNQIRDGPSVLSRLLKFWWHTRF